MHGCRPLTLFDLPAPRWFKFAAQDVYERNQTKFGSLIKPKMRLVRLAFLVYMLLQTLFELGELTLGGWMSCSVVVARHGRGRVGTGERQGRGGKGGPPWTRGTEGQGEGRGEGFFAPWLSQNTVVSLPEDWDMGNADTVKYYSSLVCEAMAEITCPTAEIGGHLCVFKDYVAPMFGRRTSKGTFMPCVHPVKVTRIM